MLKRIGPEDLTGAKTTIEQAHFPVPFKEGLEYSSPARGTWNIVHTGMMIPESHQIFVCAMGCLRGVVLTAAEAGVMGRYSSIMIREENVLDGTMESLMIDGVEDIIGKLPYKPKAILLFISCQHFFLAYDQDLVFAKLRAKFPDIKFMDCYMIPTLRKSGLTPDQKMRIQMYSLWENVPKNPKKVNHIGSNIELSKDCEIFKIFEAAGCELWDLYRCKTFDDYMSMAESSLNIYYEPLVKPSAEELKRRLGQQNLYLSFSFDYDEIEAGYEKLSEKLGVAKPYFGHERQAAEEAIRHAKELIGETPVVVDYTFTFRILSFARFLLEHGFNVTQIYGDGFLPEDEKNFRWIQEHFPKIQIISCNRPKMRFVHEAGVNAGGRSADGSYVADLMMKGEADGTYEAGHQILAIGQKCAYFTGTDHFVNVAESGGFFGYDGIVKIAALMEDAYLHGKDRRLVIQKKGYGCESCVVDEVR